jgi:aminopeptidase N
VRAFLQAHPDYNPKLRAKLLQASDDLFRAEKLVR